MHRLWGSTPRRDPLRGGRPVRWMYGPSRPDDWPIERGWTLKVLALDLSLTATGVAACDGHEAKSDTWKPGKLRGEARLVKLRDWTARMLNVFQPQLVLLEDYAYSRPNRAHQVGELGGVIRVLLHEAAVAWRVIGTAQLKQFATGKGNASKDAVLLEAARRFHFTGTDNHAADAWIMVQMARSMYELPGAVPVPKRNAEVLYKINWPVFADL